MNEIATFSEINFSSGDFISSFHDYATILALTNSENEYNYNHKHQSNLTSVRPDARLGLLLWPRENVCSHSPAMSRCRPGRPPSPAAAGRSPYPEGGPEGRNINIIRRLLSPYWRLRLWRDFFPDGAARVRKAGTEPHVFKLHTLKRHASLPDDKMAGAGAGAGALSISKDPLNSTNFRAAPQCIRLFLIHIHRPTLYVSIDLSLPLRSPERASQARMSMGSFRVTSRDVNPAGRRAGRGF